MLRKLATITATTLAMTGLSVTTVFADTNTSTTTSTPSSSTTSTATTPTTGTSPFDTKYLDNLSKEQDLLQKVQSLTTSTPQIQLISQAVQSLNTEIPKLYASEQALASSLPKPSVNPQLKHLEAEQALVKTALAKVQSQIASLKSVSTNSSTAEKVIGAQKWLDQAKEQYHLGKYWPIEHMSDGKDGHQARGENQHALQQKLAVLKQEQMLLQNALTKITSAIQKVQSEPQIPNSRLASLQKSILALQEQDLAFTNLWNQLGQAQTATSTPSGTTSSGSGTGQSAGSTGGATGTTPAP